MMMRSTWKAWRWSDAREKYTGNAGEFRASEFIDAVEDLAGRTRNNPVEVEIEKAVVCNSVTNKDGKKENGVFALAMTNVKRRLRVNATKRKILIVAAGTPKAVEWKGLKIRLYQTVDSDRVTGGKTYVPAVAMDVLVRSSNKWIRYYDFQQPKGKRHVEAVGS